MNSSFFEVGQEMEVDDVSLEELLEQKLLCGQGTDTEDMTERALSSARRLIQAIGRSVAPIENDYVGPIRDLTDELQALRR